MHRAFARVLGVALAGGVPEFRRVVASLTSRDGPGQVRASARRRCARRGVLANRRFRDALARLDDACRRARCPALVAEIHARRATAHLKLAQVERARADPGPRGAGALDARLRAAARECDPRASNPRRRRATASVAEPGPAERREPSSTGRPGTEPARRRISGEAPRAARSATSSAPSRTSSRRRLCSRSARRRRPTPRGRRADAIRTRETFETFESGAFEDFESGAFAPSPRVERALGFSRAARRTRPVSVRLRVRRGSVSFLRDRFRRLRDARVSAGAAVLVEAARASTHAARARRGRCGACFAALRLGECVACRGCAQRAYCAERCRDADARGRTAAGASATTEATDDEREIRRR